METIKIEKKKLLLTVVNGSVCNAVLQYLKH